MSAPADRAVDKRVSFDDEPLILVDENDNEIGHRDKVDCHTGHGTLHERGIHRLLRYRHGSAQ